MTHLFVFGLGYSSQAFIARYRSAFSRISGTVRSEERAAKTNLTRSDIHLFDGSAADAAFDPAIAAEIADADMLLVSAPPDQAGDPVLRIYADAIASAPRLRFIAYLSTIGVYGDHKGALIDEEAPLLPTSARNTRRVEVERQWLALGRDCGKATHIFRLAGIYGPGRNALVKLRDGTARRIVREGQVFNRIHVDDIALAVHAAWESGKQEGIWNVTDNEPGPPQDVIAYGAKVLGVEPPPEMSFEEANLPPMARSFWGENKRVSNARLRRELGIELAYPNYRIALDALGAAGEGR